MTNIEKPKRKSGSLCPFFKKDVSQVCHKCDFYKSMTVTSSENPGKPYQHWDCAIVLNTVISRDIGASMNGLQKATEDFRNQLHAQNQTSLQLLTQVVAQSGKLAQGLSAFAEHQVQQNTQLNKNSIEVLEVSDDHSSD